MGFRVLDCSPLTAHWRLYDLDLLPRHHKGEWRWRLKAANGRILADSGEGYVNLSDCLEDIDRVKGSTDAPVKKE